MSNILCNWKLVYYIQHTYVRHVVTWHNTGLRKCTKGATPTEFGMVWFDKGGITNILSLRNIKEKHNVRCYHNEYKLLVLKSTHKVIFKPRMGGLYYHDVQERDVVLLKTVQEYMEGFTYCQIAGAKMARSTMAKLGHPS